jgi:hypothetical protein
MDAAPTATATKLSVNSHSVASGMIARYASTVADTVTATGETLTGRRRLPIAAPIATTAAQRYAAQRIANRAHIA